MCEILDGFSLVWVLMYRHSKSAFLQGILNWSKWVLDHSNSNFAHSFYFHCLTNLAKSINLSWILSVWCELLYKRSIYTLKSYQWITIWWARFELECLVLIFIYFNSKFKVTCKNGDFECRYIRTHSEEKTSKISNIAFVILPFSHQNVLTKLPSWVLWNLFLLMKPPDALQNGSFLHKESKIRVPQSQVRYLHTTRSSALKLR